MTKHAKISIIAGFITIDTTILPLLSDLTHRYFIIHKPMHMVSQFVSPDNVGLLGNLDYIFPSGTHAIGRLDINSEGLLLLTTNKKVTRLLFSGDKLHKRVYLVQINNDLNNENLLKLRNGVVIKIKNGEAYLTPPCDVFIIEHPEKIFPYAHSDTVKGKHTWICITLTEGKFRQVRKMMAAIRHRCKRLIRVSIENMELGSMKPGQVKELGEAEFFEKLNITIPK